MLIASGLIVGTIGVVRRYIPMSSAMLAFFRGAIGAAFLCAAGVFRGGKKSRAGAGKTAAYALSGAFIGINWMLLFEAYNYTTVAKATLCYYLEPTIVILLSPLLFGERLTARKLLCAAVAVAGMFLVTGAELFSGDPGEAKGVLLALGAAFIYALVIITNKKTGIAEDIYFKTEVQLLAAALVMLPYLAVSGGFKAAAPDLRSWLLLLLLGVFYTGFAYLLYFAGMEGLRTQTIAVISYVDPVTAMFASTLLLGEPLSARGIAGAALIIGSAIVSQL